MTLGHTLNDFHIGQRLQKKGSHAIAVVKDKKPSINALVLAYEGKSTTFFYYPQHVNVNFTEVITPIVPTKSPSLITKTRDDFQVGQKFKNPISGKIAVVQGYHGDMITLRNEGFLNLFYRSPEQLQYNYIDLGESNPTTFYVGQRGVGVRSRKPVEIIKVDHERRLLTVKYLEKSAGSNVRTFENVHNVYEFANHSTVGILL